MKKEFLKHGLSVSQADSLRRSMQGIAIAITLAVLPFAVNNFMQGRFMLGLFSVMVIAVMSYNLWNATNGRLSYKINFLLLTPALLLFFLFSIRQQGVIGFFWSYPALIMCYFILPERLARIANLGLLLVVISQVWIFFDSEIAIRASVTLVGVSILCVIFVRQYNKQQLRLEEQAFTDALTGLSNRMKLTSILNDVISENRHNKQAVSVLSLDLDRFKEVNDLFGHDAGDRVLTSFGNLLNEQMDSSGQVFRVGGEEFLVLLSGADAAHAQEVAKNIHASLAKHQPLPGLPVTVSIGIATLDESEDREGLLRRSDQKLYQAKADGRNCTRY